MPGGLTWQLEELEALFQLPAGHGKHAVLGELLLYVPGGHTARHVLLELAPLSGDTVPAGHC